MRFSCISEVRAYWEALRDGRPAPYRSELDPRGIERALEYSFVLERIAPRVARFRLAGMHLTDLMGMEVRGMPFTALFTSGARDEIGRILDAVCSGPRTAEITIKAEGGFGKPALDGRIVLLPLRSDLGDISRVLGCLMAEGSIGRTPRRFDVSESLTSPITDHVPDVPRRSLPTALPLAGFADAPAAFARAAPAAIRRRGHLRLVVSDE